MLPPNAPPPPPPARPPRSAPRGPLPHISLRVLTHHESTPHATPLSAPRGDQRQPSATLHGAGQSCPAPTLPPSAHRAHATAHTPKPPTQAREHANKQGGQGAVGHRTPHHPTKAPTPRKRKHPHEHEKAQPSHPASKHAHNKPQQGTPPREHTKNAHTKRVGANKCVSAGTRVPSRGDRHEAKQAKPPQGRARRTSAHKASAQTTWFAPKRCRPAPAQQGVRRERKAAHNSPRQSAWVVVFVGVFADVCRRFEAGWLGGLGVFWGCLACFLVF